MEPEVLDIVRPLLIMGGAMCVVMLGRELRAGWIETVTVKRLRERAQERQKPAQKEDQETEQD